MPLHGIAQNPAPPPPLAAPAPPAPPVPPNPPTPQPTGRNQSGVFLGVETTGVPSALSDQLNLPEGFGLLVEYVVPGSAAEAAGVKTHDILKMLNDQVLTSEGQLSVLVRSFSEGQEISLAVLRKGQETKLTAKLQKRPERTSGHPGDRVFRVMRQGQDGNFNELHFNIDDLSQDALGERIRESLVERSRAQIEAATTRSKEQMEQAMEMTRERTARTTGSRVDLAGAFILLRDATGRVEINVSPHGQRRLTVRDAEGKKVFDGRIDTPEQRKTIPTDVLPQVEALERDQAVTFPKSSGTDEHAN